MMLNSVSVVVFVKMTSVKSCHKYHFLTAEISTISNIYASNARYILFSRINNRIIYYTLQGYLSRLKIIKLKLCVS